MTTWTVWRQLRRLSRWPVESQAVARRNAMVAATALAERRAEREDVEEYLRRRTDRTGASRRAPA